MSSRKNKIAIIIPVYNRQTTVLRALESVLSQQLLPTRFLVVDDGSTDGTAVVVERWMKTVQADCDMQLIRAAHKGAAAARNKGLAMVTDDYDFVSFLDSDDVLPPDFLIRTAAALTAQESLVAVSVPRAYHHRNSVGFYDLKGFARDPVLWMFKCGGSLASCSLFRLQPIKSMGGFDEQILTGHDMALFSPLAQQGEWQVLEGAAVSFYRYARIESEERNLVETFANRYVPWALLRETIFKNQLLDKEEHRGTCSRVLSGLWLQAAFISWRSGKVRDAYRYLVRTIRWGWKYRWFYVGLMKIAIKNILRLRELLPPYERAARR